MIPPPIHPTRTDDPSSGGTSCSPSAVFDTDCSLRNALIDATVDGESVSLAAPSPAGPYTVTQGKLMISHNINLIGAGARVSTIEGPAGTGGTGGVLEIGSGAGATVQGVTITGGRTLFGGGIDNLGALILRDSTVTGNLAVPVSAEPGSGGGIFSTGTLTIIGSTVSGNAAAASFSPGGPAAGSGGGIFSGGTTTIVNSTISGNTAGNPPIAMTGDGGGIDQGSGTLSLSNVTLASNSAGRGGNLFNMGTVSAKNTIIAGGTASSGSENCAGSSAPVIASQGYNVEDRNQCGLSGPGDQTNTDPLLGGLQDNGGQTDTRALAVGSPAVNHGNPHGCTDASATLLMVDQRGMTRPEGLACDVGPYDSSRSPRARAPFPPPAFGMPARR